jgi:hypothetical protein
MHRIESSPHGSPIPTATPPYKQSNEMNFIFNLNAFSWKFDEANGPIPV